MAIKHTKYFFDEIWKEIGDSEFDNFLELSIDKKTLDVISDSTCSSSIRKVKKETEKEADNYLESTSAKQRDKE